MSGFVDQIERDLIDATRRRTPGRATDARRPVRLASGSPRRRSLALAAALVLLLGGATAGAALLVLRGSVIQAPSASDVPVEQRPVLSTEWLSTLRAPDPAVGQPPWSLRLARSQTGLWCSTVGQVLGGRFGLVGTDGRFRLLAPGVTDSCGAIGTGGDALLGARVFDAPRRADVRTVISGIAGPRLRGVRVATIAGRRSVPVGAGGTFVVALRGYPEDLDAAVSLMFPGHVERHFFGIAPGIVRDPLGAGAWRAQAGITDGDRRTCVTFAPVRSRAQTEGVSPPACGLLDTHGQRGYFFAIRRLTRATAPTHAGSLGWGTAAPRTAVWGLLGADVLAVEIHGPGLDIDPKIPPGRTLLAVMPARVDPGSLTVQITFTDGHVERHRGDTNLIDREVPTR